MGKVFYILTSELRKKNENRLVLNFNHGLKGIIHFSIDTQFS